MVNDTAVSWFDERSFNLACNRAEAEGKPVLLDFHAPSCGGCSSLEKAAYANPSVVQALSQAVVPVRVVTDSNQPDAEKAKIIGRHIFIWSPTVQMTDSQGVPFHEFPQAPRHTRLDMGYNRVHHDLEGEIGPLDYVAQIELGVAKHKLIKGQKQKAITALQDIVKRYAGDSSVAAREASYWLDVALHNRLHTIIPASNPSMRPLAAATARFCDLLMGVADHRVMHDWPGSKGPEGWVYYTDNIRELVFGMYQVLLDFGLKVQHERGDNITMAQRILAQHHRAYRDFVALIMGFKEEILDAPAIKLERTIRGHYVHVVMAEWWAHTPQIRHGRKQFAEKLAPSPLPSAKTVEQYGRPPEAFGSMESLLGLYEKMHWQVIEEMKDITDAELEAPTIWWEPKPVSLRFRLNRLGWHLRDHTTNIESQLLAQRQGRSEMQRLCQQIILGLGEAEAALIGAEARFDQQYQELTAWVNKRADEVGKLLLS